MNSVNLTNGTSAMAPATEKLPMWKDDLYCSFSRKNDEHASAFFKAMQKDLESYGRWIPAVPTRGISLSGINPVETLAEAERLRNNTCIINRKDNAVSDALLYDTATGTGLLAMFDCQAYGIRPTAMGGLHNAAGLNGPAFGKMDKSIEATVLQHGLDVATGHSQVLLRGDKISGIHSSKYVIMPISEMIDGIEKALTANFGEIVFDCGSISHSKTTARWYLKEAQPKLMQQYQDALTVSGVCINTDWMPIVDFVSSDTADSAARLIPGFLNQDSGDVFRFSEGIAVEHKRQSDRSGKEGVELFLHRVNELYALWEEGANKIKEMASFILRHPENALIELSIKVGISKKYAAKCLETLESIMINAPVITMHEVYLCLSMAPRFAKTEADPLHLPSPTLLAKLQEAVARVLTIPTKEWATFDVAGHSSWKN